MTADTLHYAVKLHTKDPSENATEMRITHKYRLLHKLLQFRVLLPIYGIVRIRTLLTSRNCWWNDGHCSYWHTFFLVLQRQKYTAAFCKEV